MKLLRPIDSFLNMLEGGLLIALLGVMIVLAFLQVVLRNVFSEGILWADILTRHFVLWIGFLGAALATSNERHISIDALTRFLTARVQVAVKVLTNLFAAVVCYFLLRASQTFLANEILDERVVYAQIPSWYAEIIIPVGFGLLVVHFLIRSLLNWQRILGKGGL